MVAVAAPNEAHRLKCEQHRSTVEAVLLKVTGAPVKLLLSVDSKDSGSNESDNVVQMKRPIAPPADEEVDIEGLVDAPPETVLSPEDRLQQAFPGSQIIRE
jgi:hypothetical protein